MEQVGNSDLDKPRSVVAASSDHSHRDAIISQCSSTCYDILTILISIADITTDIMVLFSYYHTDRMTFFWISITILLAAQIGYVLLFWWSFDFMDDFDGFTYIYDKSRRIGCGDLSATVLTRLFAIIIFLLLIPFGHFAAFVMYFAENERLSVWMREKFGIERINPYVSEDMTTKFAREKLHRHGGFILEALLEALPQSMLQLIAMVYYEETSYIAVGSIILSMISIMIKSLVISQGLDWKSYIWCWLCVCTDFFSIFFIVSWIFLSNEHIDSDFLGIFNIFGEIWCWKVLVAIVPFFVFGFVVYIFFVFGFLFEFGIRAADNCFPIILVLFLELLFILCGNAIILLVGIAISIIGILFMEIMCFSIPTYFWWLWCIECRWDKDKKNVSEALGIILDFVGSASRYNNDRIIRILAVNIGYDEMGKGSGTYSMCRSKQVMPIADYIRKRESAKTLHSVTYADIRDNCGQSEDAREWHLFQWMKHQYVKDWREVIDDMTWTNLYGLFDSTELLQSSVAGIMATIFCWIEVPLYMLSRIVSVFYPYFIVGYLCYYDLWNEMALFELVMLGTYIGLQVLILLLGISVFRTHYWLWHVLPGLNAWDQHWRYLGKFQERMYSFYDSVQWAPVVRDIITWKFDSDIGLIVMDYVDAIELEQTV